MAERQVLGKWAWSTKDRVSFAKEVEWAKQEKVFG